MKRKTKYVILFTPPLQRNHERNLPTRMVRTLSYFTEKNEFTPKQISSITKMKKGEVINASFDGDYFVSRIVFMEKDKKAYDIVEHKGWGYLNTK